jgi:hypothetical protein
MIYNFYIYLYHFNIPLIKKISEEKELQDGHETDLAFLYRRSLF